MSKVPGYYKTPRQRAYRTWVHMIDRCHRPDVNPKAYPNYGGRGISVCVRWRDSFEAFLADVGLPPDGMTLERKENDGDYEPGNCRWATRREQTRNSRRNKFVELDGRKLCRSDCARELGVSPPRLRRLLNAGLTAEQAREALRSAD